MILERGVSPSPEPPSGRTYCRGVLETLRRRRYLGLFAATFFVALVCFAAGTWQIARFKEKHHANTELRGNNDHSVTEISQVLGPAVAATPVGQLDALRHVSASGTYLTSDETLVRGQIVGGSVGYLVLTPFKTDQGVLLIVRGFVGQTERAAQTPKVPAAPSGVQTLTARLRAAMTKQDRFGALPANQVESINPGEQSKRLGAPVWNGYAELLAGQPGTGGLTAIPDPDMSNPAGGAEEPQHAAYVVQWYIFGLLALALPFVLAAAERKRDAEDAADGAEDARANGAAADASAPGDNPDPPVRARRSRRERRAELDQRLAGRG